MAALALCLPFTAPAQTTGATFGDVIPITGGTPSDIVLDEFRHQLYLVSNNTSLVYVYDYSAGKVTAAIPVGKSPVTAAMSRDAAFLYVTSGATPLQAASGSPLLNVIDLGQNRVIQ